MGPVELAEKYVEMGRKTGKTTAMVMALPDEKCAIITSNRGLYDYIKDMIRDLRPDYNIDNVVFLTYAPGSGWRDQLLLRNMHVYFDNSVIDDVIVHHVSSINQVYGKNKS